MPPRNATNRDGPATSSNCPPIGIPMRVLTDVRWSHIGYTHDYSPKTGNKVTCSEPLTELFSPTYLADTYWGQTENTAGSKAEEKREWIEHADVMTEGVPQRENECGRNCHHDCHGVEASAVVRGRSRNPSSKGRSTEPCEYELMFWN